MTGIRLIQQKDQYFNSLHLSVCVTNSPENPTISLKGIHPYGEKTVVPRVQNFFICEKNEVLNFKNVALNIQNNRSVLKTNGLAVSVRFCRRLAAEPEPF